MLQAIVRSDEHEKSKTLHLRKTVIFSASSQIKHLVPESPCPELGHLVNLIQSLGPPVGEVKTIPIKGAEHGKWFFPKENYEHSFTRKMLNHGQQKQQHFNHRYFQEPDETAFS